MTLQEQANKVLKLLEPIEYELCFKAPEQRLKEFIYNFDEEQKELLLYGILSEMKTPELLKLVKIYKAKWEKCLSSK
jgi:hypothetical protein